MTHKKIDYDYISNTEDLSRIFSIRVSELDLLYIREAFPDRKELRQVLVTQALLKLGFIERDAVAT